MQLYDYNVKDYLPSAPGMGMLVEVKDPEDEVVLSRVSPLKGKTIFYNIFYIPWCWMLPDSRCKIFCVCGQFFLNFCKVKLFAFIMLCVT